MSFTDQLKFIEGGTELLNRIEPLWEQSKALHTEKSTHFSEIFANTRFSARKEVFEDKALRGKLLVILAKTEKEERVGYCVCSLSHERTSTGFGNVGEIDSMFVLANYRKHGIGRTLVKRAMAWFEENEAKNVIVLVGVGNEEVLDFYGAFGLLPIAIRLEWKSNVVQGG
jgi:ribosomal protein S18 acetylase RimI-like enzyme